MDSAPTLAIIGTAGRQDDAAKLAELGACFYQAMLSKVVEASDDWKVMHGVSGGAAYADHLAVSAYLDGRLTSLTLYVPAEFTMKGFTPNPQVQFNPGATLNRYHQAFSRVVGFDSIAQLQMAIDKGAKIVVQPGFKNRNLLVARDATHLIAFTFGDDAPPVDLTPDMDGFGSSDAAGLKDGGTAHTFREAYRCVVKRHVSLAWLTREHAAEPTVESLSYNQTTKKF